MFNFFEDIIKQKFEIIKKDDPIYLLKSIKNKIEIQNMIQSHIYDGVALTKFIYWMKKINKKEITEFEATKKLERFRKNNQNYLYPSFNTIAGSGGNGAIVHYRATKENSKKLEEMKFFCVTLVVNINMVLPTSHVQSVLKNQIFK